MLWRLSYTASFMYRWIHFVLNLAIQFTIATASATIVNSMYSQRAFIEEFPIIASRSAKKTAKSVFNFKEKFLIKKQAPHYLYSPVNLKPMFSSMNLSELVDQYLLSESPMVSSCFIPHDCSLDEKRFQVEFALNSFGKAQMASKKKQVLLICFEEKDLPFDCKAIIKAHRLS